jgi:hypothetical protein
MSQHWPEPMNCKELIEAMAKKGLWTSPGRQDAPWLSAIGSAATVGKSCGLLKALRCLGLADRSRLGP